jgi:hypothetical protein
MLGTRGWISLALLLAATAVVAQTTSTTAPAATSAASAAVANPTPHLHQKVHKTTKPLVLPPLPAGPLRQLPMDQLPPTPAQVRYEGGLLSIAAQNSTLSEILNDVRQLTGASIDIPPGSAANERVVTSLGPGEPRDVLARLLNGSSFNYVMTGSTTDPNAVASLILMVKPLSSGEAQPTPNVVASAYENSQPVTPTPQQPMPFRPEGFRNFRPGQPGAVQQANAQAPNADSDDDKDDDSADDSDDSAQTQPAQPGMNNNNNDQSDQNQPNAGPKTPEQIMQMLQRAQQPGGQPNVPPQPPQQ